jgi:hypothetical protein
MGNKLAKETSTKKISLQNIKTPLLLGLSLLLITGLYLSGRLIDERHMIFHDKIMTYDQYGNEIELIFDKDGAVSNNLLTQEDHTHEISEDRINDISWADIFQKGQYFDETRYIQTILTYDYSAMTEETDAVEESLHSTVGYSLSDQFTVDQFLDEEVRQLDYICKIEAEANPELNNILGLINYKQDRIVIDYREKSEEFLEYDTVMVAVYNENHDLEKNIIISLYDKGDNHEK